MRIRHGILTIFTIVLLTGLQWASLEAQTVSDSLGCFNYTGYDESDSSTGMYNFVRYETSGSSMSPDRRLLATYLRTENYPGKGTFYDEVTIIDLSTLSFKVFLPGTWLPTWSPDGRRLLTPDCIYYPDGDSAIPLPKHVGVYTRWSADGAYIYFSDANALWRCNENGMNLQWLGKYPGGIIPWTVDSMIYIHDFPGDKPRFYLLYDLSTSRCDTVWAPELQPVGVFNQISFSRNRRFFVADAWYDDGRFAPARAGLCMYDFERHRLKDILPGQPFRIPFFPSWSSDSTLLISFICHLDSSYTTWEIDTNGVFLRQLTNKTMLPGLTRIGRVPVASSRTSFALYPQPTSETCTVEFDIEKDGVYSLVLVDPIGHECAVLVRGERIGAGKGSRRFSTRDLLPGVYFVRLSGSYETPVYRKLLIER